MSGSPDSVKKRFSIRQTLKTRFSSSAGRDRRSIAPLEGEEPIATLRVQVLECRNLIAADMNGKSDPYVVLIFQRKKQKTPVIQKTLNPVYTKDSTFDWPIYASVVERIGTLIDIVVWDWDRLTARDYLGELPLPCSEWFKHNGGAAAYDFASSANKSFWLDLQSSRSGKEAQGSIHLKVGLVNAKGRDFAGAFGTLSKHSATDIFSAPATRGFGTVGRDDRSLSFGDDSDDPDALRKAPPAGSTFSLNWDGTKISYSFSAHAHLAGILLLEIVRVDRLPKKEIDAAVVVTLGDHKARTRVLRGTATPAWGERVLLRVGPALAAADVRLSLLDWEAEEALGATAISLTALAAAAPQPDSKTGLYAPVAGGIGAGMQELRLPLGTDKDKAPLLVVRAKFEPHAALRQRFWRAHLSEFDADHSNSFSAAELVALAKDIGVVLDPARLEKLYVKAGKGAGGQMTLDEAITALETLLAPLRDGAEDPFAEPEPYVIEPTVPATTAPVAEVKEKLAKVDEDAKAPEVPPPPPYAATPKAKGPQDVHAVTFADVASQPPAAKKDHAPASHAAEPVEESKPPAEPADVSGPPAEPSPPVEPVVQAPAPPAEPTPAPVAAAPATPEHEETDSLADSGVLVDGPEHASAPVEGSQPPVADAPAQVAEPPQEVAQPPAPAVEPTPPVEAPVTAIEQPAVPVPKVEPEPAVTHEAEVPKAAPAPAPAPEPPAPKVDPTPPPPPAAEPVPPAPKVEPTPPPPPAPEPAPPAPKVEPTPPPPPAAEPAPPAPKVEPTPPPPAPEPAPPAPKVEPTPPPAPKPAPPAPKVEPTPPPPPAPKIEPPVVTPPPVVAPAPVLAEVPAPKKPAAPQPAPAREAALAGAGAALGYAVADGATATKPPKAKVITRDSSWEDVGEKVREPATKPPPAKEVQPKAKPAPAPVEPKAQPAPAPVEPTTLSKRKPEPATRDEEKGSEYEDAAKSRTRPGAAHKAVSAVGGLVRFPRLSPGAAERASCYAALILADARRPVTGADILGLLSAAGIAEEPLWASVLERACEGRDVLEVLLASSTPGTGGTATITTSGDNKTVQQQEKVADDVGEEDKPAAEESDDDMGFGLFD